MVSVNASYAIHGVVKAVYSSTLWFDNVVGRKVSTVVKAMLEEQPIDDPHATFVVFRRLDSLGITATSEYGWTACDIDDMLSPHCEYCEFEVQTAEEVNQARSTANDVADLSSQSEPPLGDGWNGTFNHSTSFFHDVVNIEPHLDPEADFLSNDRSSSEESFCYGSGSDNGFPTSFLRGNSLGVGHGTFEATPPIIDTNSSCKTSDRALSVPFSEEDDASSDAATDATYTVGRKGMCPKVNVIKMVQKRPKNHVNLTRKYNVEPSITASRPKKFDLLRSLELYFSRVYELGADSTAIIAGEARFWDGAMWASAISDGTSLSAENRRCLRKYAEKLEKIEAKSNAARRLVDGVINKLKHKSHAEVIHVMYEPM
ncbi:hypothetical protein AAVH_24907 [Aphelenchoides avenae]|nr:hypothetical protein AAVH_24907 [Aphelenchus avenae]